MIKPHSYGVVWLTNDRKATRGDLGLQSTILKCDRMQHCYEVETDAAEPWLMSAARRGLPADVIMSLEAGRRPGCWWVALQPVEGRLLRKREMPR